MRYFYQQLCLSSHLEPEYHRFTELIGQTNELENFFNSFFQANGLNPGILLSSTMGDKNLPFPLKIRFALMNEKINELASTVSNYEDVFKNLRANMQELQGTLRFLMENKPTEAPSISYSGGNVDGTLANEDVPPSYEQSQEGTPIVPKAAVSPEDDQNFETEYGLCMNFDKEAEEIVRLVQPRENQFDYRNSATRYLKKQIMRSLNCPVLDISFHELKCFLPDDPIKMTVVLNQAAISTWHKVVYDRLLIISEQDSRNDSVAESDEEEEEKHAHKIKTIRLVNESSIFKVIGVIDNVPFEVVANARVDLCMLAFFEEVNSLIGRDHLMKRSILLIRSWWLYETGTMSDKSPKEFLPDFAIWLMVVSIFNKYHNRITSPVQALYLFLYIFATFDGNTQAITLQGIRSFTDYSSNLMMWDENCDLLIPPKLFEKYFQVVNIHNTNPIEAFGPRTVKVDRCGYTVVHPFTYSSLTLEKLSNRKSEKILQCFKTTLSNFSQLLIAQTKSTTPSVKSIMRAIFPETLKKIGAQSWRVDTFSSNFSQMDGFDLEM